MKIYYIKGEECKDITNGVATTVGVFGMAVIGLTGSVVWQTASIAMERYSYACYLKDVCHALNMDIKNLIPLRL